MPDPGSLDLSAVQSLLDQARDGGALSPDLQQALGTPGSTGSIDLGALTSGLANASSGGPSFLDPAYLMISGSLQLVGVGFFVYARREGDPGCLLWAFACFALSWDYTSLVCWLIAAALAIGGKLLR